MTQVIIDDIIPRIQLVASAGQTVFNTNWTADAASDILVYSRAAGIPANDETQLVSSSDYNVTFIGGSQTVRVTFLVGRTLDDVVTIVRDTPAERTNLYINTNFVPSMLNQDFGILTLVDQQAQMYDYVVNPGYNVSATIESIVDTVLPILAANQVWAMNEDRTAIIAYDVPAGGGVAPSDAKYLLQVADSELPNAQAMGALASGFVVNTTATGVQLTRVLTPIANQTEIVNGTGVLGNPTIGLADNAIFPGFIGVGIPTGTTAQRPVSPIGTDFRFNSDLIILEYWDGSDWVQLSETDGVVTAQGTANQILVNNTAGTPVDGAIDLALSPTLSTPGTFTIQGTTAIAGIINDPTMATATTSNMSTSAAIKAYVDSLVTGLNIQGSCVCGTTTALTVVYNNGASGVGATLTNAGAQAVLTLDGVSPTVNQRVLVKNQAAPAQNGIYTVTNVGSVSTNWVMTRATDYDQSGEIQPGDLVVLTGGTTQAQSSWLETATVTTIGTDAITFVQFTASLPVNVPSGGTGVTSFTPYAPIVGGITSTGSLQQATTGIATTGAPLVSGGSSALPSYSTTPLITQILDVFGNVGFEITGEVSGVNWLRAVNNDTTNPPGLLSIGSDTNIGMVFLAKAAGNFSFNTTLSSGAFTFSTGTGYQHLTQLTFPDTAATRSVTFPDQSGSVLLSGNPAYITSILDSNGVNELAFTTVASAVNYFNITNQITGLGPTLQAAGSDAAVPFNIAAKGAAAMNFGSEALTNQYKYFSGTSQVHSSTMNFPVTAANRTYTWPDADGTVLLSSTTGIGGLKSFQIFTSGTAATYTRPAGITSILVEAVGGGGGSGGCGVTTGGGAAAGGGGGGAYARLWVSAAASSYSYTVGAGGTAGSAGANNGAAGTASTFVGTGANISAGAGSGGNGASSSASAAIQGSGGSGGSATGGDVNLAGGNGETGYTINTAGTGLSPGGTGGGTYFGAGAVRNFAGAQGLAGAANTGAGASGACITNNGSTFAGAAGGTGIIIVWEFA